MAITQNIQKICRFISGSSLLLLLALTGCGNSGFAHLDSAQTPSQLAVASYAVSVTSSTLSFNTPCASGTCSYAGAMENGSYSLSCSTGTIQVNAATYGANGLTESCLKYVGAACNGHSSCAVDFSNYNCGGDPIVGVVKSGTSVITCLSDAAPAVAFNQPCQGSSCSYSGAVENGNYTMGCAMGTIQVQSALYGSLSAKESCFSGIASACNGKTSCSVAFTNSSCGGDPAYGIVKAGSAVINCATPSAAPTPTPAPAASPTPISAPTPTPPPSIGGLPIQYPGANLSSGEYALGNQNARLWWDYAYPNNGELDYFASKGMKVIRIPFDINKIQRQRLAALDLNELSYIDALVQHAQAVGLTIVLDPHNYGYMNDNSGTGRLIGVDPLMPASYLADFWSKMATHYLGKNNVFFGLMNEPNAQNATQWHDVAIASVDAIRAMGAMQKILIPGTAWTGAQSWVGSGNAAAWTGFNDANFAFEVHEYLDSDNSGTHVDCLAGKGSWALTSFTDWARSNHVHGFLGETGWSTTSVCTTEGNTLMSYMKNSSDVFIGYTYWSAGPWMGSYMYSIEPSGLGSSTVVDKPQLAVLRSHM